MGAFGRGGRRLPRARVLQGLGLASPSPAALPAGAVRGHVIPSDGYTSRSCQRLAERNPPTGDPGRGSPGRREHVLGRVLGRRRSSAAAIPSGSARATRPCACICCPIGTDASIGCQGAKSVGAGKPVTGRERAGFYQAKLHVIGVSWSGGPADRSQDNRRRQAPMGPGPPLAANHARGRWRYTSRAT